MLNCEGAPKKNTNLSLDTGVLATARALGIKMLRSSQ